MIVFDEGTKTFLMSGKNYSYVAYVNGVGLLQHIYYGKKIEREDLSYLVAAYGVRTAPRADDFNYAIATDWMPTELASFGRGDFHTSTVRARREDGAAMSEFRYLSYKIVNGALPVEGMPCARDRTL